MKDRADHILAAAAQLFRERGYHGAGIDEIGEAAGISGPAVYRHFSNKEAVLVALAERALTRVATSLDDVATEAAHPEERLAGFLRASVSVTLDDRDLSAIFLRELRHVTLPSRLRRVQQRNSQQHVDALLAVRPELDADHAIFMLHTTVGLFSSVLYYKPTLARKRLEDLLTRMAVAALAAPLPEVWTPRRQEPVATRSSRREIILAGAVEMFHKHGYKGVGIDDIGVASDITGPGVYRYFQNKDDLLSAVFTRAGELLAASVGLALSGLRTAGQALDSLIDSYAEIAVHNPDLIGVYLTESYALPGEQQSAVQRGHRMFVDEWVNVLRQLRPSSADAEARALVHGALGLLNGYGRVAKAGPKEPGALPFADAKALLASMAKHALLNT